MFEAVPWALTISACPCLGIYRLFGVSHIWGGASHHVGIDPKIRKGVSRNKIGKDPVHHLDMFKMSNHVYTVIKGWQTCALCSSWHLCIAWPFLELLIAHFHSLSAVAIERRGGERRHGREAWWFRPKIWQRTKCMFEKCTFVPSWNQGDRNSNSPGPQNKSKN